MRNPVSRFAYNPASLGDINRSSFTRNQDHKTTMSAGKLYPIYIDDVMPGDTFSFDMGVLARMSTPIHPVMDNSYMDIYFFHVPLRLVWDDAKEFFGEHPSDPYNPGVDIRVPHLVNKFSDDPQSAISNDYVTRPKSVMDYMGVDCFSWVPSVSALDYRAFSLVWNEFFRDQNLMNPIDIPKDSVDREYITMAGYDEDFINSHPDLYVTETCLGGVLPPVAKYHDYFTSALLEPQKGAPVPIPINGFVPVYAQSEMNYRLDYRKVNPLRFYDMDATYQDEDFVEAVGNFGLAVDGGDTVSGSDMQFVSGVPLSPGNLTADLSSVLGSDIYGTINDLRYAFQIQKLLEADNRGGTRYRELILSHFGVTVPDATVQVPEFLGGKRIHINVNQVLQTSSTDSTSPQGNTAAYSLTSDKFSSFTKSFTEHGLIIGVACIRTEHTYQQGIERRMLRRDRYDYYWPELANISEQGIKNQEIWIPSYNASSDIFVSDYTGATPNEIFGFQEAWADYRYKPNRVSGEFRTNYEQSLDVWHYADFFETQPKLDSEFIRETRANIDRTLAVSSDLADQFIVDFYFKVNATRPMPVYSIPGLADHH